MRMGWALKFLTQYHMKGNELIECIVIGDDSWIHFWMPETKTQSKVWKKKEEDTPKKFKAVPSAGKVMLTIFWDSRSPFYWELGDDGKGRARNTRTLTPCCTCGLQSRINTQAYSQKNRAYCTIVLGRTLRNLSSICSRVSIGKSSNTLHTPRT